MKIDEDGKARLVRAAQKASVATDDFRAAFAGMSRLMLVTLNRGPITQAHMKVLARDEARRLKARRKP